VAFASIAMTRLVPRTPGAQSAAFAAEGTRPQIAANVQKIRQGAINRFPDDLRCCHDTGSSRGRVRCFCGEGLRPLAAVFSVLLPAMGRHINKFSCRVVKGVSEKQHWPKRAGGNGGHDARPGNDRKPLA
jgi:hypothetical protein